MGTKTRLKKACLLVSGMTALLLLFLAAVFFCIPRSIGKIEELYGTYVLDCELVHEELTLRQDGTFTQDVTVKATLDGASSEGTWSYNDRTHTLNFDRGFMNTLGPYNAMNLHYKDRQWGGTRGMPAEYWCGRLILGAAGSHPVWRRTK